MTFLEYGQVLYYPFILNPTCVSFLCTRVLGIIDGGVGWLRQWCLCQHGIEWRPDLLERGRGICVRSNSLGVQEVKALIFCNAFVWEKKIACVQPKNIYLCLCIKTIYEKENDISRLCCACVFRWLHLVLYLLPALRYVAFGNSD